MARVEKVKAEKVEASYAEGNLLILAQGQMHDTCIQSIRIVRARTAVEPPKFVIERTLDDGQFCGSSTTPWAHLDVFEIGAYRETIEFGDASGDRGITVSRAVPFPGMQKTAMRTAGGGGGDVPVPFFTMGAGMKSRIGIEEAVGYSEAMSFAEALQNALKKLPHQGPGYPDELRSYTVTSIRVELGGVAGFRRLRVGIQGTSAS